MSKAARNSLKLSAFTIASRLLGVVRDHYQAVFFGTGAVAAAWEIAYLLPNMLRNLLADGILAQSFIPVYSEALDRSEEEARRVSGIIITFLFFFLLVLVLVATAAFPYVLPLIADHSGDEGGLLIELSQVMFVFIMTASLTAIFAGIANTHHHFSVPALSPIVLNLVFLCGFFFVLDLQAYAPADNARLLAIFVVAGGFMQLGLQIAYNLSNGWSPKLKLKLNDPALKKIFLLMAPAVLGAGIFQLNQLTDIVLASYFIPDEQNAIPALRFAQRLIQLPTGVIGVALSTAILPALARGLRDPERRDEHSRELEGALVFSLFVTVPAGLGLFVLGEHIINLIYYGGNWDLRSTDVTLQALVFYSFGVPFFSLNRVLTSAFFAHQDTATPLRLMIAVAVFNLCVNLVVVHSLYQSGIAMASVLSSALNTLLLTTFLRRKYLRLGLRRMGASLVRLLPVWLIFVVFILAVRFFVVSANGVMLVEGVTGLLGADVSPRWTAIVAVLLGVVGGGAVYFAAAWVFRVEELRVITGILRRRRE